MRPTAAAYVDSELLFQLVARMEACGIATRWPHPLQLWKLLTSKEWMATLCICPQFQIPLTSRISKSLVLQNPSRAAFLALEALKRLKKDRQSSRVDAEKMEDAFEEEVVAKLGYSYEGVDVKMVKGRQQLAEAIYFLLTQPNYTNDCVYVQERIKNMALEARCFLMKGTIVEILYTRFARIDCNGYVREYEKETLEDRARRDWFFDDHAAWQDAFEQIKLLSERWNLWLIAQASEPTVSVRILVLCTVQCCFPV